MILKIKKLIKKTNLIIQIFLQIKKNKQTKTIL